MLYLEMSGIGFQVVDIFLSGVIEHVEGRGQTHSRSFLRTSSDKWSGWEGGRRKSENDVNCLDDTKVAFY